MAQAEGDHVRLSRREFMAAAVAGGLGLAAASCGRPSTAPPASPASAGGYAEAIETAEAARPHTGRTVATSLTPQPVTVDIGGPVVRTLAYGESIPAPVIRAAVSPTASRFRTQAPTGPIHTPASTATSASTSR